MLALSAMTLTCLTAEKSGQAARKMRVTLKRTRLPAIELVKLIATNLNQNGGMVKSLLLSLIYDKKASPSPRSGVKMKSIAAFGEIMLRLSPPGSEKLFQSPELSARFGGGEANVAISLAVFGHRVRYISICPPNEVGEAAVSELRRWGVEADHVLRQGKRLGVYFAETGANQRPGKVIYDRDNSALAEAKVGSIDWDSALQGVDWLHTTGI